VFTFQKKSKQGIRTPKKELDLIRARLRAAQEAHDRRVEAARKGETP
jgi:phage-related protein